MVGQVDQFRIVNNDNSKGLKFHYAESFGDAITINNVSVAAPGQSASQNFIRNFGGFKRIINVDFMLFNDGTDKSTDASSKITLSQQRKHLQGDTGVIQGNSTGQSSVTYTVSIFEDGAITEYTGGIEDINVRYSDGMRLAGSFNLNIGQ